MENELAVNKKAYFDYEILENLEAGIILSGPEVKSCREKKIQLKGSYLSFRGGKIILKNTHISPYPYAKNQEYNPLREREILMHKKEGLKLEQRLKEKSLTLIPLKFFLKKGLIKVLVGICRGKKKYDKRAVIKKREQEKQIKRAIKKHI